MTQLWLPAEDGSICLITFPTRAPLILTAEGTRALDVLPLPILPLLLLPQQYTLPSKATAQT